MSTPMRNTQDPVLEVVAAVLGVKASDLEESSSPETVGAWESSNHLSLVMAVEEEFDVSLTPDEALEMTTIGLIRATLREHGVEV